MDHDPDVDPPEPSRSPLRRPQLVHLESLCNSLGHWLEVARLRQGEKPRRSRRFGIINATAFLCVFRDQLGRDWRWAEIPRYIKLDRALGDLEGQLSKMMVRGRLSWKDGQIDFDPGEMEEAENGSYRFPPAPIYLSPEAAKVVERALLDLREIRDRSRAEGEPAGEQRDNSPAEQVAGRGIAEDRPRTSRRKRGRIQTFDPEEDRLTYESWHGRGEKSLTMREFAKEKGSTYRDLRAALDRHRKRIKKDKAAE